MSLERKDVRFKLSAEDHARLKAICEIEEIEETDMDDFVEALVVPVVRKRVHEAIELADKLQRAGITGHGREYPGEASR